MNKIKCRILKGEVISYRFAMDYPGVGKCLVIEFNSPSFVGLVAPSRYAEYLPLLRLSEVQAEVYRHKPKHVPNRFANAK